MRTNTPSVSSPDASLSELLQALQQRADYASYRRLGATLAARDDDAALEHLRYALLSFSDKQHEACANVVYQAFANSAHADARHCLLRIASEGAALHNDEGEHRLKRALTAFLALDPKRKLKLPELVSLAQGHVHTHVEAARVVARFGSKEQQQGLVQMLLSGVQVQRFSLAIATAQSALSADLRFEVLAPFVDRYDSDEIWSLRAQTILDAFHPKLPEDPRWRAVLIRRLESDHAPALPLTLRAADLALAKYPDTALEARMCKAAVRHLPNRVSELSFFF